MSELTQPLAVSPKETVAGPVEERPNTTFSELVYAHFAWWKCVRDDAPSPAAKAAYHRARGAFERRYGEIVTAYWCTHVESAVALTHKPPRFRWGSPVPTFHRESDWATQNAPDIARELHRCDELAVKAKTVLTGVRRLICMQLVVASASHLLSLVDGRAAHADPVQTEQTLAEERAALDHVETYYCGAANGQAQIVYFAGMAVVALSISLGASIWLALDWQTPVAALVAGALGAVVSVIQRINAGTFELEYDVGKPYAFFLGGLRPLIGATFAVAISFAFTGGFVHLPVSSSSQDADHRLALLVIAFVAGFSERWAQDTLVAAVPMPGGSARAEKAEQKPDGQKADSQ
jgi:hypothetical protein